MTRRFTLLSLLAATLLCGCSVAPHSYDTSPAESRHASTQDPDRLKIIFLSMQLVGTPYKFGGNNVDTGFDCSGMVSYVYEQSINLGLKGRAADMARAGRNIHVSQLQEGDLLFFNTTGRSHSHVGIYIGQNRFVHAPSSGKSIRIESLDNRYFKQRFEQARTYL